MSATRLNRERWPQLKGGGAKNGGSSVTVTYRREDGNLIVSKVGIGRLFKHALADADAQLRPGRWERLVVSTVNTIYADLKGRPESVRYTELRKANAARRRMGEGAIVEVAEPVVVGKGAVPE